MAKKMHLKRLAAPRTWPIARKSNMFIKRPAPSGHPMDMGVTLLAFMTELTDTARSSREVRAALNAGRVLVDGIVRKKEDFLVGILDTVEFPALKKAYRLVLSQNGKLVALPIESAQAKLKAAKIVRKTAQKGGGMQLTLHDGHNIIVKETEFKVGDGVILNLPGKVPESFLRLEKGAVVYLTHGAHRGMVGTVSSVEGSLLHLKLGEHDVATQKSFAFVIGKGKASIAVK